MSNNNNTTIDASNMSAGSVTTSDVELAGEKLKNELTESIHGIDKRLGVLENIVNERNRSFKFTVNTLISIGAIIVTIVGIIIDHLLFKK